MFFKNPSSVIEAFDIDLSEVLKSFCLSQIRSYSSQSVWKLSTTPLISGLVSPRSNNYFLNCTCLLCVVTVASMFRRSLSKPVCRVLKRSSGASKSFQKNSDIKKNSSFICYTKHLVSRQGTIVSHVFVIVCVCLTTSRRLTCIHAKLFPTVKRRTCIHVLRHYSQNSYSNFGRHTIFSESSGSCLGDPGQNALQTTIELTLFVDFCLIPLSNACSFVRPARNVNREIFLHYQEGFCVGKFGRVVYQAVLDNRPLRKHFRRSRLRYKRQALLKI